MPTRAETHAAHARFGNRGNPQPAPSRKSAIVIIGGGIGNLVEQSPLILAVQSLYHTVDVWCPISKLAWVALLQDIPGIRSWFVRPTQPQDMYDAAFGVFLTGPYLSKTHCRQTYLGGHFERTKVSETETCMLAARAAGFQGESPLPVCASRTYAAALPAAPLIGIAAGGIVKPPWKLKRYPHYAQLVASMQAELPNVSFVNLGTQQDDAVSHPAVHDLRGRTTLLEVADIFTHCQLVVANDCGLGHIAAAMGTPTYSLFGPTRTGKNTPYRNATAVTIAGLACQPCQYTRSGIGRKPPHGIRCKQECLQQLDPQPLATSLVKVIQDAYA